MEDKDLLIKQLKEENKILKLENAIAKKVSVFGSIKRLTNKEKFQIIIELRQEFKKLFFY
ncbi:hypothetical protein MFE_06580 [Mycoplasmopsis fermentans JER]|nr:hypothetical protein [Mycoplasmopsis fermentans]ADN69236.1 hypothetical protein MFE_06580 [Mycoplasmopsis fermentans JER]